MEKHFLKRRTILTIVYFVITITRPLVTNAQIGEIVQQAFIKAIKAMDLKVQRLQNKTIWLQNAQKSMENMMSKLKLDEISEWTTKHKAQYEKYFEEFQQIKQTVSDYSNVKEIINKQVRIVSEYKAAINLFKKDAHFSPKELEYMMVVYTGIINESLSIIDHLLLVITPYDLEMNDADRLTVLEDVSSRLDNTLDDLLLFNNQNARLSLSRSKDMLDFKLVKSLYGLN
ncbi:MAG: conjugal transfer protein TraI [Bacteroidota bacterium]